MRYVMTLTGSHADTPNLCVRLELSSPAGSALVYLVREDWVGYADDPAGWEPYAGYTPMWVVDTALAGLVRANDVRARDRLCDLVEAGAVVCVDGALTRDYLTDLLGLLPAGHWEAGRGGFDPSYEEAAEEDTQVCTTFRAYTTVDPGETVPGHMNFAFRTWRENYTLYTGELYDVVIDYLVFPWSGDPAHGWYLLRDGDWTGLIVLDDHEWVPVMRADRPLADLYPDPVEV